MARTPVYLNIYDMYWLNEYASNIGVGVFHSGIEVYGLEYAYGGHPLPCSGIFENTPKDANELGENFKFRESILIGETDFSASEVRRMVQLMGEEYSGDRYHLISKNCNHFTSALAKTLTGNDIPSWVNRLASISNSIPFLERWIPQEWLTPIALQHSLDEKSRMAQANAKVEAEKRNAQNGTAAPPSSSTQQQQSGWKWFQRRASSTIGNTVPTATDITTRSVPNTARSMATASASALNSSSENVTTATATSSPSLTRLWNSIKSVAVPPADLTTCNSSSSSLKSLKRDAGNSSSGVAVAAPATKSSKNDKELNNRDSAAPRS